MSMQRGVAGSGQESGGSAGRDPNESQFSPMPRYFFNTRIGDELIADPEGEELRNPDRAWEMARAMILELLRSEGADERLLNATVEVTDDDGEIVLEFPFAEALLDGGEAGMTKHSIGGRTACQNDRNHTVRCDTPSADDYSVRLRVGRDCFRLPSAGKKSKTPVEEANRAQQACRSRRLPSREKIHEERHIRAAQPLARRCLPRCFDS